MTRRSSRLVEKEHKIKTPGKDVPQIETRSDGEEDHKEKNGDDDEDEKDMRIINLLSKAIDKVVDKKMGNFEMLLNKLDTLITQTTNQTSNQTSNESNQAEVSTNPTKTVGLDLENVVGDENKKKEKNRVSFSDIPQKLSSSSSSSSSSLPSDKKVKETKPPHVLSLSYKINCVSDVSATSCTFEVDIKVFMYWCDSQLIGRKSGSNVDYSQEKDLFEPNIIVTNEHMLVEVEKDGGTKVVNSRTGEVKRTVHLKGTVFLGSMDLKLFPFDCQNLQVCFKPYKLPKEELLLVPKLEECAIDRHIMHEWDVLGHCVKLFNTDPATSSTQKSYSTLFVTVLARRKFGWHIMNVFIPTAAFLVVSWLVFTYSVEDRGERNDVVIATLLASISNKFVIGDHIPKIDYRTLLDMYLDFCFYMQVFTMFATVLLYQFRSSPGLAQSINTFVFIAEVVASLLFHEWMYVKLSNHEVNIKHWVKASQIIEEPNNSSSNNTNNENELFSPLGNMLLEAVKSNVKRESSLSRFMKALLKDPEKHVDDSTLMNAISSSDHFIHFGAMQISKKTLQGLKKQLASSFQNARVKNEQIQGVVQTLQLSAAKSNFIRHQQSQQEGEKSGGIGENELTKANNTTSEDLAAKYLQGAYRRRITSRKLQELLHKRKVRAVKTIWKYYRKYKKRKQRALRGSFSSDKTNYSEFEDDDFEL